MRPCEVTPICLETPAEQATIAAKYPGPITYPPPKGTITFNMTEYDLRSLPWKAESVMATGNDAYSRGVVYHYRSDDPKIPALDVTVMNRRVTMMRGGYE